LSAEKGLSIAKGVGLPSIYLNISAGTNYTNLGKRIDNIKNDFIPLSVRINGNPSVLDFPFENKNYTNNPYFNQLSENIGGGAGISLKIPIYNNGTIRAQKEKAMLNIRSAEIRNEQTKQQLKTDIQRAIANAKAALKQYEATVTTYNAALAAFENAEKRYKIGAISTYDFNTSRTTMDTSLVDVTLAKYDYIFKLKVVEFYEGKKLSINN
jgi:outer membrane protein